jgi:hypothetical protein
MSKSKKLAAPQIVASQGIFKFPDGSIYEGDILDNVTEGIRIKEGQGVLTTATSSYNGKWVGDAMNGYGVYIIRNTQGEEIEKYEGELSNNQFHGQGAYHFKDGSSYQGQWQENKMHGLGNYTDTYNVVWRGSFHNGKYDSLGNLNSENISSSSTLETANKPL